MAELLQVNSVHHRHTLFLLSPKADTHLTIIWRIEATQWLVIRLWLHYLHTEMVYLPAQLMVQLLSGPDIE